jgi:hypothetical protein
VASRVNHGYLDVPIRWPHRRRTRDSWFDSTTSVTLDCSISS